MLSNQSVSVVAETRQSAGQIKPRRVMLALAILVALAGGACRYNPADMADELMRARVDSVIDSLLAQPKFEGKASVGVYASDRKTGWVYRRNADSVYHAASTMKVPVMIELFRQAEQDRFSLDDSLAVENRFSSIVDGSPYAMDINEDSDESIYGALGSSMSIRDLAFQMITVSSNLATNILIDFVSADSVQATVERLGARTMRVLRGVEDIKAFELGLSNTATAGDLGVLMEHLATGSAVSREADRAMVEILSAQRFKEMIPAGLPDGVEAAHKTGSITRINHDAAIVSPEADPWVLVILTGGVDDHTESARLGSRITEAIFSVVRGGTTS